MTIAADLSTLGRTLVCLALECDLVHEIDDRGDASNARLRFRRKRCDGVTPWKTMKGMSRVAVERTITVLAEKGIRP